MNPPSPSLPYPRNRLRRGFVHLLGRLLLPLLFKFERTGGEKFPDSGPLIVVGNHTAAMEAVFINIYTPWSMEMLSAADIPAEPFIEFVSHFYGVIPLHRGSFDRAALRNALDVLDQGGVVGLFPEGGIWEEGKRQAQTGVAWLSYRSGAPVLPIGFSDTTGKLNAALNLKRPEMKMNVGTPLPAARLPEDISRKAYLQSYADQVMEAVHRLVPPEDRLPEPRIVDERFELKVSVSSETDQPVPIPENLRITSRAALAKILHRPAILKIFRVNLDMPVEPLESLHRSPSTRDLLHALQPILNYLEEENPYMLTYRFGPREGAAMEEGLHQLYQLLNWAEDQGHQVQITPVRKYFSRDEGREITQVKQGRFSEWM